MERKIPRYLNSRTLMHKWFPKNFAPIEPEPKETPFI